MSEDFYWRQFSECPEVMKRPGRCFVRVEGWKEHSGSLWHRSHCGLAGTSSETVWGFRQKDIDRLMEDGDMDGIDEFTHWMPAVFPRVTGRREG